MSTQAPAARPMRADARRNYDKLVEAAREMFAAKGSDVAFEDIAKHAGVGVGTLYRHFPRRIDIVAAVYSSDLDALVEAADVAVADPDALAGLTGWLSAFTRYLESKRVLLNALHEAFERDPGMKLAFRERMRDATARVLGHARDAGVVKPDITADDLLQLVGGMCMSATATPAQNERLLGFILAGIRTD